MLSFYNPAGRTDEEAFYIIVMSRDWKAVLCVLKDKFFVSFIEFNQTRNKTKNNGALNQTSVQKD